MRNNSIFDKYINENKNDIIVYFMVLIVVSIVLFIIGKITNFYYILLLDFFSINAFLSKIIVRRNLIQIEKYIYDNNLNKKIGEIEYWNDNNYFLTTNCIILLENKVIDIIPYEKIKSIYYKSKMNLDWISHIDRMLYIILDNDKEYSFLVHSTLLVNENTKDIGSYLKSKNKKIKIIENK